MMEFRSGGEYNVATVYQPERSKNPALFARPGRRRA
jgi:hypothetical protein